MEEPDSAEKAVPASKRVNRFLVAAVVVLCILLAATLISSAGWWRVRPTPLGAARIEITLPENTVAWANQDRPDMVPSPDGRSIAYTATSEKDKKDYLWVQPLTSATAQRLDYTEGAALPFWSADSKFIGFMAGGQLKRIPISGGIPQVIGTASTANPPQEGLGAAWNDDGTIIVPGHGGLVGVNVAGGEPVPVTQVDKAQGEIYHTWPQFLPDGKHFLYLAQGPQPAIYVQQLGSSQRTLVLKTQWRVLQASGYLLFVRDRDLFAQRFDLQRFRLEGGPVPVVHHVNAHQFVNTASFSVSANGVLAYRSDDISLLKELTWFDRSGHRLGTVAGKADYSNPSLSPDGNWLAVGVRYPDLQTRDIWLLDLVRGTRLQLTSDPADDLNPTWSPDGKRIAFTSNRRGRRQIYIKDPFSTADEQLILADRNDPGENVEDWSPDGRWIAYNTFPGVYQIFLLSPDTGKTKPYTLRQAFDSRFSPDGKWVAYGSRESGTNQVFIQSFPATESKWQISTSSGNTPQWRADGKELYYAVGSNPVTIMAVDVAVKDGAIHAGVPHALFSLQTDAGGRNTWVAARDGQKFLSLVSEQQQPPKVNLAVIYNWPSLLEKR